MTVPTVPITVWEQLGVVVVFAFLLGGVVYALSKSFLQGIADINKHYSGLIERSNIQWQQYFDARIHTSDEMVKVMTSRMDAMLAMLEEIKNDFSAHDMMERQALDSMRENKEGLSKTTPRSNRTTHR